MTTPRLHRLTAAIDRLNDRVGRAVAWLVLVMTLVGAFNAVARYLGRGLGMSLSSNLYIELQWYLFAAVFLLGAASALRTDSHVRVDVLYGRLSERGRLWIDLAGGVLFLLPFCGVVLWLSWPSVLASWTTLEGSPDAGGLPRYPVKSLILVGFALLFLQGVAEIARCVARLRGEAWARDEPRDHPAGEGV